MQRRRSWRMIDDEEDKNRKRPPPPPKSKISYTKAIAYFFVIVCLFIIGVQLPFPDLSSGTTSSSRSSSQLDPLTRQPMAPSDPSLTVAIIGGGLAGLSAAIEILEHGGSVVIIEKSARLGGNSAKASSGINAANSGPQAELHIKDSVEDFFADTLKSGKGLSDLVLASGLTNHSADAISFLQSHGVNLAAVTQLGGHSHPRTHRSSPDGKPMNIGFRIMSTLIKHVEKQEEQERGEGETKGKGKVTILKSVQATSLVRSLHEDGGRIKGVEYKTAEGQTQTINADSVILATGGYSSDRDGLLARYTPLLTSLATTNGPFATGDGVRMGEAAGAATVHMDQVQLHPTSFLLLSDPLNPAKFLGPEALRGVGGILVNQKGQRFVDELTTRDKVVDAIMQHCDPLPQELLPTATVSSSPLPTVAYLLLNDAAIDAFDRTSAGFYLSKGLILKYANAAEAAAGLRLPESSLRGALESYGRKPEDPFGKSVFPILFSPDEPLYVAPVTPALHYCMGGLRFDESGRILSESGKAIRGLFGAGEVTGGLHGANRLGGNSLLECVVYGRIAGKSAFEFARELVSAGEAGAASSL